MNLTTQPNFTRLSVYVACGCGSVLLWQHWDTLCNCSFVDDIVCRSICMYAYVCQLFTYVF